MKNTNYLCMVFAVLTCVGFCTGHLVAQETSILDDTGKIVRFDRDIAPIFVARCLECHGPDDAKNDFRIDQRELVFDYVEPEDLESSALYTDYLITDDEDMRMPPQTHGGPLLPSELALVRTWIVEGADWPEDSALAVTSTTPAQTRQAVVQRNLLERIFAAQGFFHPATVHFPIALLTLGALFVVLGWKWPSLGTQIPLACLLIGAVSAVAATAMGWAFAEQQGYGAWDRLDMESEVFWHRWSGVILAAAAAAFAIVALISLKNDNHKLTKLWKVGLLLCAGLVGAVGHQGGEMSYGKDLYPKAWRILTGQPDQLPVVSDEQQ